MEGRFKRLEEMDRRFGFLLDTETLLHKPVIKQVIRTSCEYLGETYGRDIDGSELYDEIVDCRRMVKHHSKIKSPTEHLKYIIQYGDESLFPNLRIALQIMLTIAVSIASCERSFSKLKLILNYLRNSMGQQRLCDLAILSIEKEETDTVDYESMIDQFATQKARKVDFKK